MSLELTSIPDFVRDTWTLQIAILKAFPKFKEMLSEHFILYFMKAQLSYTK